ncbi:P-loop containing nucleoside triphosphate hydrolase protein [Phyllosticta capitalensis]
MESVVVEDSASARAQSTEVQPARTESLATRVKQENLNDQLATPRRSITAIPEALNAMAAVDSQPLENVGKYIKELVKTINRIEELGIREVAGETPKIVVVGDQSAGKSSVINAISGIQVPRDSGTCTRCPMQITLTDKQEPNAQWRCDVSIRKEFCWREENRVPQTDEEDAFFPWFPTETDITRFKTVYDKSELPEVIARAQLAILNPDIEPILYTGELPRNGFYTEFSPNLVCLDISAPGLPNLSFYDLPGVIAQSESDNPYLTSIVKALVKKYVAKDNATVLLCCAMEGDIQNSTAMGLVYSETNAKHRTLGILTKPDRLPEGDPLKRWEGIINGDLFANGHGWHVVKNPSQADIDRDMDHAAARRGETTFFTNTAPWNSGFARFQNRFGTRKLEDRLSTLLAKQILASLPTIREKVQQALTEIHAELAHLPEPPTSEAQRIVYDRINAFTQKISDQIKGDHPEHQFRMRLKQLRKEFRDAIQNQRPILIVRTPSDGKATPQPAPPQMRANSVLSTPTRAPGNGKRRQDDDAIVISDGEAEPSPTPVKRQKTRNDSAASGEFVQKITLDDIRKELDIHTSSDIPGEIDPRAVNHLRKTALANWDAPTKKFIDGVENALKTLLAESTDIAFRAWKTTELAKESRKVAQGFLNMGIHEQRQNVVPRTLRLERLKPMTENEKALEANQQEELAAFNKARLTARSHALIMEEAASTGKPVPSYPERQKKINSEKIFERLGPDPYAREVEAMAKVRAYYTIASMRFIDHINQSLQAELFDKFENLSAGGLRYELMTVVCGDQEKCVMLLAEDPAREQRRRELQRDKAKLEDAMKCLQEQDDKFRQMSTFGSSSSVSEHTVNGHVDIMEGIVEEM